MSDGIRDELRELLLDSAPPAEVDTAAMFERTFAVDGPDGAELLPPDGLFDLPPDDPADELFLDAPLDPALEDPALDGGPTEDGLAGDGGLDLPDAVDDATAWDATAWDADAWDAAAGDGGTDGTDPAPDTPFGDHGTGAGW